MPKIDQNSRKQGIEWRWAKAIASTVLHHPRTTATASVLGTAIYEFGPVMTGSALAATAATGFCLYRGAPHTWDRTVGPWVSAWWRRWSFYQRKWVTVMNGCDLSRLDKTTGELQIPRLRRVRVRRSWDVLYVRPLPGQTPHHYEEAAEALAGSLLSNRVAVQRLAPNEIALLVERFDPFGPGSLPVPASEIPPTSEVVDLKRLDVGSLEDGAAFELGLLDSHVLVVGMTRSGKSGAIWNPLRQLGPMIRDGLVRVHGVDLKGGAELELGKQLFSRYARGPVGALKLLRRLVADMEQRQQEIRAAGRRKFSHSEQEPFELLIIDELLVLTAVADNRTRMEAQRLLTTLLTQGAGLGFCVMACVQDPTTDGVPMRKFFTTKIALRLDQANHVDMILGEGKRLLGALADQIPADQHGVGYVAIDGVREPRRFRFGLVTDDEIRELVNTCSPDAETEIYDEPLTAAAAA